MHYYCTSKLKLELETAKNSETVLETRIQELEKRLAKTQVCFGGGGEESERESCVCACVSGK